MFKKRDPVCRAKVSGKNGYSLKYGKKTYYFDCQACRTTFQEDPMRFIKKRFNWKLLEWVAKGSSQVPKSCHKIKK